MIDVKDYKKTSVLKNTCPATASLAQMLDSIESDVSHYTGLSSDDLFWAQIDAGEQYLKGRIDAKWFLELRNNKGFWHWYRQIWCKAARGILANSQPLLSRACCLDFAELHKYIRAKADGYGFEPVLQAIHSNRVYDGQVIW